MNYLVLKQPTTKGIKLSKAIWQLLLVMLVLLMPGYLKAQHRDSFPSPPFGLSSNPVIGTQAFNVTESIYMNYEIGSNNFTSPATAIRRIAYNLNSLPSPVTITSGNFKIYMKNAPITDTIFSNTCCYSTSGYTLVYDGPLSITDTGIFNINLSTPFVRTSGTNLMVLSQRTDSITRSSNAPQFRCANGTITNNSRITNRRYNNPARPTSNVSIYQLNQFRPAMLMSSNVQAAPYIVGTTETYTSLTNNGGLFQALANNPLTQNTTVTITSDLSETGTHKLTGAALNGFSLTIKSSTNTTRVISCLNSAFPMITIDSAVASSVTFDGAINGSGQYLRFVSTNTAKSSGRQAFLITKGSRVNIYNCIIEGNSTSPVSYGLVQIASGNNQFTMRTSDVRAAIGTPGTAGTPSNLIYSASSGNRITIGGDSVHHGNRLYGFEKEGIYLFQAADSVLIRHNHVYQNANVTGNHHYIYIASGSRHNISNNAIYQSSGTSNGNMNGIIVITSSGNNHRIENNSIGGANENRTGAAMSFSNNGERNGIWVVVNNNGFTSIQGNRISNISSSIVGTANGIRAQGNVRIGTEVGNIIGGGNLPSDTMSTAYDNGGIIIYGSDTAIIENNTIGNFSFWSPTTGRMTGITSFQGAYVRIHNNTIRDFNSHSNDQGTAYFPAGIAVLNGAKAGSVIDSNLIFNINRQIPNTGSVNNSFVAGIYTKGTATSLFITNNTIYNIRNFSTISGTNAGRAIGLFVDGANTNNVTVSNNQIALNNNSGNEALVYGILEMATGTNSPTNRYFYNSVFVGGSMSGGSNSSYAFYRDATHSQITLKNNILFNQRTGGTGYGYALGIKASTNFNPGISNYNALVSVLDSFKVDYLNVPYGINGFITSSLNDSNSVALNATTHTAASFFTDISTGNLSVQSGKRNLVAGKGTPIVAVTVDIGGTNRSTSTPTIGAFEYGFTATPTITTSGTLTAFSSCAGTASTQQSFSVGGTNLTANIIITPPAGYEVSTTSGTGFTSSVSLTPSSGTIASTTIYVRLTSSATGTPSGNIVASSTGATSQNVSASGTVNALPTITLGSVSSVLTTATSFNLPYSATTGSPNQYSITTGTPTAVPSFSSVINASLSTSPIAVTIPASAANTYNFNITVRNSTTGCASANTPFAVSVTAPGGPAGPPVINSINPTFGKPGDTIILSGSDFNSIAANNQVFIGGMAATVVQASGSQLRVIVPNGAIVDNILVTNTTTGLSGQSSGKFTPSFSPVISNLSTCYFGSTVVKANPSAGPRSIAVGDLTGDGKPDLVVAASNPARISIYRNISNTGSLDSNSFDTPFSLSVLSLPNEIVIKDFDRDGKQDIAVVNYSGAQLALFKNQYSSGTFDSAGFAPRILIPATSGYFRMAAGDIDNDGKIDLVAARVNGFVGVFKNNSSVGVLDNTSFSAATSFPILPNVSGIDLADFNNDGKVDIVLSSYDSAIVNILQNTSTTGVINSSSFAPRIIIPTNKKNSQGVVAADFDNDGKVDFATAGYTDNYLRVFQNTHTSGNLGINSFATVDSFLSQSSSSIFTGDLTGDGKLDVIMGASSSSNIYKVLVNTSTPGIIDTASFAPAITLTGPNNGLLSLKVADLNGDSKPEIIGAFNFTNQVSFKSLITPSGVINTSGTLTAFNSCTGFVSDTQSVIVTGSGLTANIIATPPAGFEISSSPTSGYTSVSLTINQSSGNVNTRVYIRLRNNASGNPSGNISFTSTCASSQNISVNGTVNALPTITLGTISSVSNTATSFNLPYSATTGSPNQYSIAAGAPGGMPSFTPVVDATLGSSPIAVTIPASAANTYNFLMVVKNSTTGCQSSPVPFSVTVNAPASPAINVSGSLTAFSTCASTASSEQSFTVSGSNLTANILVIPPSGFEVSSTSGAGFASSVTLTQSSGSVAATTVYVRLASGAPGTPSGNITASSTGATSQTVAANGTVNTIPTINLGSVSSVFTTATSFNLPFTSVVGSPNQYSITTGSPTAMPSFSSVTNATLSASPIAVTIPASAANTYNFNITVRNSTTGCVSSNVPFTLTVANPSISNNTISSSQLICSGTAPAGLVGSTPIGGNNTFAYTWLRSTTSATGGFSAATGTNNQQNYLPPSLTQNTWFRRLVSSAGSSDTSAAVLITVGDTTKPIARPRNMVAYLNSAGTLNLTGTQVDSASFDNCDIQSRTLSRSSFNCTQIGSNQIYLIITDANGNKDSALSTITVLDTVAPNAIAQNRTLYLNAIGSATLTASQVNNGSTDACGIATLGINKTSFNCSNLGNNTVTLTVTDVNGNAKTANATITVLDTIKPTVSVNSGLVLYLNAQGTLGISASQFVSGSNDNCGIVSTTLNPSNINCSHLGITPVTVTVTDAAGNKDSATTNAIVLDPIAPVARPKARLTIYLSGNGQAVINPTLLDSASTDNCSITSKVLSQSVFNCNNIGTNNVTFTVQDQSGNSNAANVIVTVLDTISPVATVSNQLVYLNNSGTGSITAAQVNNNSTDNCGIQSVSISKNTFNCSDLGTRTIQFTATDLNGNSRTVPVIVNVFDTIRPVIRPKRNVNIYLNASGNATLTLAMADSASTDNCSMGGRNLSQTTFTCANLGANTVTLNGTDSTGNIGQATFTVTVIDTISPALSSKPATIYLNNTGTATLTASQVIQSSSDNCGNATASLNTSSFTCANLGNNTVNITLTDASNNNRVVSATVTVVDTLKPNAIAQNRTIYLNAAGLATITATQVDNGSTDNCTISNRSISKSSFTAADLGSNLITLTITDNSNNSSQTQALITVLDTVRPVVQTQNRTIYLNSAGTATVTAAQVNNGSTDNVGITGLQLSKTLFTCTDLGSNQVFLTATDISNNSSSLAATITVLDTIKPVVNSQNVTLFLNGIGQATLTTAAANNGSTDNCSVASLTLSKTLFTCNDRGVNTIQLNAIDASNNMATGNLQVTVVDTTRPNVVVNNNLTLYLNSSGTASLTTAMVNNGSTDNCGIVSQTLTKTSFNGTNLGLNLVTYTIADASNNQNSVVLNITVLDTMRPVLNAQNRTIYLDASGSATLTTAMVNNGSTDNVGIAQMQLSKTSFNCSNIGSNQVTFSIIDASLNQTSTLVTITVLDTIKPLAAAQNLTVYLNAAGIATITTAQANNGSADNCGTANLTLSKQTFGCTDRGNNSVTLTVTDGSNNSSTVNFNVTVLDTIKPVILANPIVLLYLDNTGNATLTTGMVNLGSYDNCNSVNLTLSKTSFNGTNLGANQVTLTVADPSNNQSTATIVVNVIDTIRPIVKAKDLTLYLNSGGSVFLTSAEVNDGSTDNVGISFTGISKSLFTCNETGTNLVEFAAQDITGNRSTKWVTITVLDTIHPIVSSFPSSVVLGHCNQDYQFSPPFASDNCGLVTTVQTSGIPNGKKYPIGTTTNTFTFTDRSGNVVTRSFTVTILPAYLPDTFPNRTACSSEPPFDLTRGNLNVEFSGSGVTLDGLQFDPGLAGPGNHAVICTFTDTTGCETKTTFFVTVYRSPDKPVIERMNSDVLQVFQTYDFYQWRRNGEDIPGANQRAYTMTKTGIYSVRVGTVAGCTTESDLLGVGVALGVDEDSKLLFNLFPNPTQSNFRVDVNTSGSKEFTIKIFDAVGKLVYESVEKGFSAEIDASEWRAGTYMVHIQSDNKSAVKPVILTK